MDSDGKGLGAELADQHRPGWPTLILRGHHSCLANANILQCRATKLDVRPDIHRKTISARVISSFAKVGMASLTETV